MLCPYYARRFRADWRPVGVAPSAEEARGFGRLRRAADRQLGERARDDAARFLPLGPAGGPGLAPGRSVGYDGRRKMRFQRMRKGSVARLK